MGQKRKQEREDAEEIEQQQINYKFKKFRVSSPIDSFDEGDIAPSPSNFSNFVAQNASRNDHVQNDEFEDHQNEQQGFISNQRMLFPVQHSVISTRTIPLNIQQLHPPHSYHGSSYSAPIPSYSDYSAGNVHLGLLVQERRRHREEELAKRNLEYYAKQNRELGSYRNHQHYE